MIMPQPSLTAKVTAAEVQAAKAALASLKQTLPLLARLTVAERHAIFQLTAHRLAAMQLALNPAPSADDSGPKSFTPTQLAANENLVVALRDLVNAVEDLVAEVDAAHVEAGLATMSDLIGAVGQDDSAVCAETLVSEELAWRQIRQFELN
jgi:acyl-CoA reductase-like NAD-dependent aldehyde dehydrogenase